MKNMSKYSIKDLEKITGVKAHTIRIWERRYGIIQPERSKTNIRSYSDSDLRKLLNISMLNSSGIKISHLAKLSSIDLEAKILELSRSSKSIGFHIEKLTLATVNFNEELFESILSKCVLESGMESTITDVLFPFFERIGVLWQVGSISPAQEHFISNLIRQKLFASIDSLSGKSLEGASKVLIYLKEGELHEVGILFYNYILRRNGYSTLYLGQDLPFKDLKNAVNDYNPDYIISSFISPINPEDINAYLINMEKSFEGKTIMITGLQLKQDGVVVPNSMDLITSPQKFKDLLQLK
ncbi:MerR family transcriptional regulator [Marinifilum caeruleilacunae]|uniref:MerR family transcriptional regulator n=1 Tax=Marinifilum caeruleilacunae TaxID=2499076 RepID=A0ABX1WQG7_9BACT|nr:MerR family transcriptional regulator [Marinifilum caeruleilacunae]NOU58231.1 MerR family transcriptional regulator [Marinifilum caeruleilacunae]